MTPVQVLVIAKVPIAGRVKTRLAAATGAVAAARIATAALLDTAEACVGAVGSERCRLALEGHLEDAETAEDAAALAAAFGTWTVTPQCAGGLDERIAHAFAGIGGPALQVGMDTPQVTPDLLRAAAALLEEHDAVLGDATDGGWWLLGLRDPARAAALVGVPMSTPETGALTRRALEDAGLSVAAAPVLTDIDDVDDLRVVTAQVPTSRTARAAAQVCP